MLLHAGRSQVVSRQWNPAPPRRPCLRACTAARSPSPVADLRQGTGPPTAPFPSLQELGVQQGAGCSSLQQHSEAPEAKVCGSTGQPCSGGSCHSGSSSAMGLAGVGSMNTLMTGSQVGLSRADIESVFRLQAPQRQDGAGEKVVSIADLLAQCPADLVFEDGEDEGEVL